MAMPLHRLLAILSAVLFSCAATAADRPGFLSSYCIDCHGADGAKAGFRADQLPASLAEPESLAAWVRVYDKIAKGEMPPRKSEQPTEAERKGVLDSLRADLIAAEQSQAAAGRLISVRRLNRVEYENTLRDLLALPNLRIKESLPEDGQQHGFDKVAGALDLSPIHVSKYLDAAEVALRQAIVREQTAPETRTWREPAAKQYSMQAALAVHCAVPLKGRELAAGLSTSIVGNPVKDFGNTYRAANFRGEADSVAILTGVIGAHQPEGIQIDRFQPTAPGWYRVRFSIWGLRWERTKAVAATRSMIHRYSVFGPPYTLDEAAKRWKATPLAEEKRDAGWMPNVEFYGDGEATHVIRASLKGQPIGYFDAPSLTPTVHEFKVWLNPGDKVSFHAMTLPASGSSNSPSHDGVVTYEGPGVAFDWFEVQGPLVAQWPPESQRRLFGETPSDAFPRPMIADAPTAAPGKTIAIPTSQFKGTGQNAGGERLLNLAGTTTAKFNVTTPGDYEIAIRASESAAGNEPAKMRATLNGKELPHARFDIDAPRGSPKTYRMKFTARSAGPTELGLEFLNDFFDEQAPPNRRDRNLFIASIDITGPKQAAVASASPTPDHRSLLLSFANRAFRRPVESPEIERYAVIIATRLERGTSFEDAMIAGYKAILCSPDFLFVGLEGGSYTLASRLSYFLWNSMPDDTLLALAKSGDLAKPTTLKAQADRLLADRRSDRFIEHFLDEWLEMKKIDFTTPDAQLYPEFDPWLRDSMLAETRAYFRKLLDEDRGVSHLIASDFVLVNQRLAELYDLHGVAGANLRAMPVPAGSKRGGFLTQAAVLKVTANGTATSPVLRGVWVVERLLGVPRNPPPPNIPAVEPDATGAVTIRQMIEKHRADAACASCHAKMDPPGLALESFDVIGGLRDRYRLSGTPKKVRVGKVLMNEPSIEVVSESARRNRVNLRLGSPVDPSGELADGRKFDDVDGLRSLLLADPDQLARNMATQFTIYATGGALNFRDRAGIDSIVAATRNNKHGLRSILHAVVQSDAFRQTSTSPGASR